MGCVFSGCSVVPFLRHGSNLYEFCCPNGVGKTQVLCIMDMNVTNTVWLYLTTKMCECDESVFFLCAVLLQFSAVKSCWVACYHQVSWLCGLMSWNIRNPFFHDTCECPGRLHCRNIFLLLLTYWFLHLDIL